MSRRFHINKHGVPAVCNSPSGICSYGGKDCHFNTYEETRIHIDKINESVNGNIMIPIESPAQKIRSYYLSGTAVNEFPLNKKIADLIDFDLVIISWLTMKEIKDGMKNNRIGLARFTYGDIVRVLEEELKLKDEYKEGLKLENKYYNPVPFEYWEEQMRAQRNLYNSSLDSLSEKLGFESMKIISLPMEARRKLVRDGYLSSAENLNEVIYKVVPKVSQFGDIIAYNHTTDQSSKEFDVYEIAGVVEGKSLHDLCYDKNIDSRFKELWDSKEFDSKGIDYESARKRYKKEQLFKGLEGTDIPRAFMRMSPIVAKEIAGFVATHRTIMMAIGKIMNEKGLEDMFPTILDEDDGWVIE